MTSALTYGRTGSPLTSPSDSDPMADQSQGHLDPDEQPGVQPTTGADPFQGSSQEPLDEGRAALFGGEEAREFEGDDESSLLDNFDDEDLESFFDPDDETPEMEELRAELLDPEILDGRDDAELFSAHELDLDEEDPFDDPEPSAEELPVAPDEALGNLFSELSQEEGESEDGQDAWALDQVVEEGMSWLMELNESQLDELDGEDEGDDDGEESDPEWTGRGASKSGKRRAGIALAVIALLGVGGYYGYQELYPSSPPETEVAVREPNPEPPKPLPETLGGGAAPRVETFTPPTEVESSEPEPTEAAGDTKVELVGPDPSDPELGARAFAGAASDLRDPFDALSRTIDSLGLPGNLPFLLTHFTSVVGLAPEAVVEADPTDAGGEAQPDAVAVTVETPEDGRERRGQRLSPEDLVVLPEGKMPYRMATPEDLAGIWVGSTIPTEEIDGPRRLLTPGVGRVRVILHGGEVFDGALYAVGEKKVWLALNAGRMALPSWQVDRIEHLLGAIGGPALGGMGAETLVGLERVRVRTPGGVFYGKLLNREQDRVTLLTKDGARITLRDAVVEPAGRSQTRIVDASALDLDEMNGEGGGGPEPE